MLCFVCVSRGFQVAVKQFVPKHLKIFSETVVLYYIAFAFVTSTSIGMIIKRHTSLIFYTKLIPKQTKAL